MTATSGSGPLWGARATGAARSHEVKSKDRHQYLVNLCRDVNVRLVERHLVDDLPFQQFVMAPFFQQAQFHQWRHSSRVHSLRGMVALSGRTMSRSSSGLAVEGGSFQ